MNTGLLRCDFGIGISSIRAYDCSHTLYSHTRLYLIYTLLDLIHTQLDLIHTRLDLISTTIQSFISHLRVLKIIWQHFSFHLKAENDLRDLNAVFLNFAVKLTTITDFKIYILVAWWCHYFKAPIQCLSP